MKELLKSMDAKLAEIRYSAETEVCSSIRAESKEMARGFGIALHMIKLHVHQKSEPVFTCYICKQEVCGIGHDCC